MKTIGREIKTLRYQLIGAIDMDVITSVLGVINRPGTAFYGPFYWKLYLWNFQLLEIIDDYFLEKHVSSILQ